MTLLSLMKAVDTLNELVLSAGFCRRTAFAGADAFVVDKPFAPLMLAAEPDGTSPPGEDSSQKSAVDSDNLMRDRIQNLMRLAADDDEAEDAELLEDLNKPKKKKFFGLF